jgi:plasmid stabilization system protein ParE
MASGSARPLEWSSAARRQLAEQIVYVAFHGLAQPIRVLDRVERAAEFIGRFPAIGTPGRRAGTREWPIKNSPLTLVYRVRRTKILVLAVVHQRRVFRDSIR